MKHKRRHSKQVRDYHGRTELALAGQKRMGDSRRLLQSGEASHARGAAYLAGYSVECRLKVIAMEAFDCWTLDELAEKWEVTHDVVYSHGLEALAKRLPNWNRLRDSRDIYRGFADVAAWRPSWRYNGRDWTINEAEEFLEFVSSLLNWLQSNS